LGALPLNGVELAARQCLSGGDYELLQRTNFQPNPDFFIPWFFRYLIGGRASAFNVSYSVPILLSGVRVFVFSATQSNGSYTILALNLQTEGSPISVTLEGALGSRPRVEYHLSADLTEAHGTVSCNGKPLAIDSGTHLPPAIASLGMSGSGPLVLQNSTIVFATVS